MADSKHRSAVWEHFELIEVGGRKKTKCKLCHFVLSYTGGTSSMANHLKKHPMTKDVIKEFSKASNSSSQRNLKDMFRPKMSTSSPRYDMLVRKIAEMCALDFRPISIVNGEGFQALLEALDPSFKVPCHTTVRNYLRKIYGEKKAEVIKMISEQPHVAITTDMWTSAATEGYITVTTHFIDKNWDLRSQILATRHMPDRHTGENIAAEIRSIVSEFKVKSVSGGTHDNAANMELCFRSLEYQHFGCGGHTLQLCVHDALKISEFSKPTARCRNIVTFFHRSTLASEALAKVQKRENPDVKPLNLIQDVATRWNSTYLMLQRLLKLRIPLYSVLHDRNVIKEKDARTLEFNDSDWEVAELLNTVLKPLQVATQALSGEYYPTLGTLYPILYSLVSHHLQSNENDSNLAAKVKQILRDSIKKRFNFGNESAVISIATALHPGHKHMRMFDESKRTEIKDLILEEMNNEIGQPPEKKSKSEAEDMDPMKFLMGEYYTDDVEVDDSPTCELEMYFSETSKINVNFPLKWWLQNQFKYPKLAKIARKYLAIPATSTPSECVFSAAGNTVIAKRASLDPGTVDELVFLHSCMSKKGAPQLGNTLPSSQNKETIANSGHRVIKTEPNETIETSQNPTDVADVDMAENPTMPRLPALPDLD